MERDLVRKPRGACSERVKLTGYCSTLIDRFCGGGWGGGVVGNAGCESAWNKDPVFGVIGIQSGPPRNGGFTLASMRDMGAEVGMLVVETIA